MEELRKQSIKKALPLIVVFLLVFVVMLVIVAPNYKLLLQGPVDLDEMDYTGDLDGTYVEGTVYVVYDWYCESVENDRTVSREYIIDAGEEYYIGMLADKSHMRKAERILTAYEDYLYNDADEEAIYDAQYRIRGTITKMPSESLKLYKEYIQDCGFDSSEEDMFLPYYIELGKVGNESMTVILTLSAMAVIFGAFGVFFLVQCIKGSGLKQVNEYIKNSGNPEIARRKVESFLRSTENSYGLRCNQDFLCGQSGMNIIFQETSKLAWAYPKTVTHKRNFITVGKTYYLVVGFADGKIYELNEKSENSSNAHMEKLQIFCPQAIFGYDDELSKRFRKDINAFLQIRYHEQMAKAQNQVFY